jgi:N-methylhydantoinase A/oxoprolinase/acetone carboxylase beta subunit
MDALAVSGYFSPLNPSHEERALAMIRKMYSLPVVLGHQLSSKLDSIKRATTACLNASLVAVMQEFIEAVRNSLSDRGIQAPLMIVKGDGSLIPYTVAVQRPVETVLSGPAASAIGGRFLSGQGSALVIDVGGTTTDLALMDDFKMTISEDGARVGAFETSVKAARIRTAGIGCDSRICFESGGNIRVGPKRVVPLSRLASRFPRVEAEICSLRKKPDLDRRATDIEYWFLYKEVDPEAPNTGNVQHSKLVTLLRNGPLNLTKILNQMEVYHPLQMNADPLLRQGVIEQATLTPTDLLHVNGQMDTWCVEAARQAVEYACTLHANNPRNFVEETINLMVASMLEEAIVFLGRQVEDDNLPDRVDGSWGEWLVREAITGNNSYLQVTIASRYPIIGIGAPAEIFIKRVAELLHTQFILPNHAPVGNAVGAVAGSVIVEKEAIVYPRESRGACIYVVQIEGENTDFLEDEDAIDYAEQSVTNLAQAGAVAAGAATPHVMVEKSVEGNLQRIVARGIGNPKL